MEIATAALPNPRERIITGWQLPSEDGGEGHTAVGEEAGSGVMGGVHAACERCLVARGDAEQARECPLCLPPVPGARDSEAKALPKRRAPSCGERGIPS
jgi:hypothetical protein